MLRFPALLSATFDVLSMELCLVPFHFLLRQGCGTNPVGRLFLCSIFRLVLWGFQGWQKVLAVS
jgi:hypothetical protein